MKPGLTRLTLGRMGWRTPYILKRRSLCNIVKVTRPGAKVALLLAKLIVSSGLHFVRGSFVRGTITTTTTTTEFLGRIFFSARIAFLTTYLPCIALPRFEINYLTRWASGIKTAGCYRKIVERYPHTRPTWRLATRWRLAGDSFSEDCMGNERSRRRCPLREIYAAITRQVSVNTWTCLTLTSLFPDFYQTSSSVCKRIPFVTLTTGNSRNDLRMRCRDFLFSSNCSFKYIFENNQTNINILLL